MINDVLRDAEARMKSTISVLDEDLMGIRTGRASPAFVERLIVDYYGNPTELRQLAVIAAPEPQLLTIRPFDPGSLRDIERAILASDLGLTPNNDGKFIRLVIPSLNEERRRDLVKRVHRRAEDGRVAVRNIRRDAQNDLREFEREKLISEDDLHNALDDLQKLTDRYVAEVDQVQKRKEKEIMEI